MLGTALSTSGRHKHWCDSGMTSTGDEAALNDYTTIVNPNGLGLDLFELGMLQPVASLETPDLVPVAGCDKLPGFNSKKVLQAVLSANLTDRAV